MQQIDFLQVGGFQVGQAQDEAAGTGVTVLLFDECAPAGVDIRGGGPQAAKRRCSRRWRMRQGCTRWCFRAARPSGWTLRAA